MKKILLICSVLIGITAQAQDFHFSQYNLSPLTLNPALTGVFNGNYRLSAIGRTQSSDGYYTSQGLELAGGGSADFSFRSGTANRIGFGFSYLVDNQSGWSEIKNKTASVSLAYILRLSKQKNYYLSAGVQGSRTVSGSILQYPFSDQYNSGLTPYLSSPNIAFARLAQIHYFDATAGVLFYHVQSNRQSQYIGFSVSHLTQPNVSLENGVDRLYTKYVFHAGAECKLSSRFDINPLVMTIFQGHDYEVNAGTLLKYVWNETKGSSAGIGPFLRIANNGVESLFIAARVDVWKLTIGGGYDINVSPLSNVSAPGNEAELSVQFKGAFSKKAKQFICPQF